MTMKPVTVMCRDDACPSRRNCARHAASGTLAAPGQPYYQHSDRPDGGDACSFFKAAGTDDLFDERTRR